MKQGWEYKKLGDVCDTINGLWTGKKPPFININVISLKNFTKDCKLRKDSFTPIEAEVRHFEKRKLQYGDIIVEKSGGSDTQPVGRPVFFDIIDGNYSFCNFTSTLRIKEGISLSPRYLYDALLWCYKRGDTFKLQSKTTGIHNLDLKGYLNLRIPLPPLSEQQSIVAELDKINEIIDLKKAQLKDLDLLAQSIFYDMFGDPIENPKGWEVKKLGEVCKLSQGLAINKQTKHYLSDIPTSIPLLRIKDMKDGTREIFVKEDDCPTSCMAYPDDIIYTRTGTLGLAFTNMYGIMHNNCFKIVTNEELVKVFFMNYIQGEWFKSNITRLASRSSQPDITHKLFLSQSIIVPPLSLQQSFAEKIQAIESQKSAIKQSLADAETLLASRMDYYFN